MEEMNEKKKINKNIVFSIVAVILVIVAVVGATFAYFSARSQTELQTVTTAKLALAFTNGDIINATNIMPISDSEIKSKAAELPFSVTNTGDQHAKLTISLTDITISNELKDVDFRWGLYNADTGVGLNYGVFKNIGDAKEIVIYKDTIIDAADPDITKNYILRIWIHDDGALQNYMQGKSFSAKVTVDGEAVEYTDEDCFSINGNEIVGYDTSCGKDVVIPKINGVDTISTGETFSYYDNSVFVDGFNDAGLTSIIIPDTIVTIGDGEASNIFSGNNLKHVTIPESVKKIYVESNIQTENVYISDSTVIDASQSNYYNSDILFENYKPKDFTVSKNFSYSVFNASQLTDIVIMEGVTEIGFGEEYDGVWISPLDGSLIESLEIPSSVTRVSYLGDLPNIKEIIVRGKTSLDEFWLSEGLIEYADIIEFRP